MIHLIFQKLLDTRAQEPAILDRFIQQAIDENWVELYNLIEENENEIIEKLNEAIVKVLLVSLLT